MPLHNPIPTQSSDQLCFVAKCGLSAMVLRSWVWQRCFLDDWFTDSRLEIEVAVALSLLGGLELSGSFDVRRVGGLEVHKFSPSEDDIALLPSV